MGPRDGVRVSLSPSYLKGICLHLCMGKLRHQGLECPAQDPSSRGGAEGAEAWARLAGTAWPPVCSLATGLGTL